MLTVTVQAANDAQQTFYSVPIKVGSQTLNLTVLVAQPGSLLTAYNNAGISDDTNVTAADFDSDGNSYSAQALAAAGLSAGKAVTIDGVTFTWPQVAPGFPDNAVADGQEVAVNAPAGTQKLGFLGSATNGPSEGVATLHYADGSVTRFWLGLSDWTLNAGRSQPSFGNLVAAKTSYRNCAGCSSGQDTVDTSILYASLPVDPSKTLKSVTLPSGRQPGRAAHLRDRHLDAAAGAAGGGVAEPGHGLGGPAGDDQRLGLRGHPGLGRAVRRRHHLGSAGRRQCAADRQLERYLDHVHRADPERYQRAVHVNPGTNASVQVITSSGAASDQADLQITPTANLADYYDNIGISSDDNQKCSNMDGVGFSYSATALAQAGLTPGGTVSSGGLTYTWPNVPACSLDNILAAGQTILVNGKAGSKTLGLLGVSTNGDSPGHDHDQLHRRHLVAGARGLR